MTGAHGVAPVIWKKEGKEKRREECWAVPFGLRVDDLVQVMYQV